MERPELLGELSLAYKLVRFASGHDLCIGSLSALAHLLLYELRLVKEAVKTL